MTDEAGRECGDAVLDEFERAFQLLARSPGSGHRRSDLSADPGLRFWSVYHYLIAFLSDRRPLRIVRILHGSRDPGGMHEELRSREV